MPKRPDAARPSPTLDATLSAYGWQLEQEESWYIPCEQQYKHLCVLYKRTNDGPVANVTGVGISRFAALLDAYKRAGLSVYL